jgi:CheY-like chemotaxis protein
MTRRILCVDDEENVLRAFERNLRGHFELQTAVGSERGLQKLADHGPFAVVVSDLRMPGMDGIHFLAEVKRRSPDTVRLMLSGNADLESAIAAVNQDGIFQFLTKPCGIESFRSAIEAALKQHQLIMAERELIEHTLNASVAAMAEVLSIVSPLAFSCASRIRSYVGQVSRQLGISDYWQFELAAMLSQIGCIAVPPEILQKVSSRKLLTPEECETHRSHPETAHSLLGKIPRLETIAEIIRYQMEPCGFFRRPDIPDVVAIGAQMLKTTIYFDESVSFGASPADAIKYMIGRPEMFLQRIVAALDGIEVVAVAHAVKLLYVRDLQLSMILNEDILALSGLFVIPKGQLVTDAVLARLRNFARSPGLREPFSVLVPSAKRSTPPRISTAIPVQ